MTLFNRTGNKRAELSKLTINTSKVNVYSPHKVIFQLIVYCYEGPEEAQRHPQCCWSGNGSGFYSARPENTDENQPIADLKPRTFSNTTVTSKKVKDFTRRLLFWSNVYDTSRRAVKLCTMIYWGASLSAVIRGVKTGVKGSNSPGAKSPWWRRNVLTMSQVLQCSTFASAIPQVRKWGRQIWYLPHAPSNIVTPLTGIPCSSALSMHMKWGVAQLHSCLGQNSLS